MTIVYPPGSFVSENIDLDASITDALKRAPEVGSSSSYWNLANPQDGSDFIVESANSYIVNAPGYYRIPLVVGNGVKNGIPNSIAYGADNFLDCRGGSITSPYLHKTSTGALDKSPSKAFIVWEEQKSIDVQNETDWVLANDAGVTNGISSTGDGDSRVYWLNFHISRENIRQGSAVIAVSDNTSDNTILWSWYIWITDYVPGNYPGGGTADVDVYPYPDPDYTPQKGFYTMMARDLGWFQNKVVRKTYEEAFVYVRLEQTAPGGKSYIMKVTRPEMVLGNPSGHAPYYQFGRKDPFHPNNGYNSPTQLVCYGKHATIAAQSADEIPLLSYSNIPESISSPYVLFTSTGDNGDWCRGTNGAGKLNWWSAGNSLTSINAGPVVKTIYDPCPAGYHVPESAAFTGFVKGGKPTAVTSYSPTDCNTVGTFENGWRFYSNGPGSPTIYFSNLGIRKKGFLRRNHSAANKL